MSDPNDILRGLPRFVELEVAKATTPLLKRIAALEEQVRDLQPAKKPSLIQRLLRQED